MTKKIRQTGTGLHPLVEAYTVGEDYILDQQLIKYDIQASLAHAHMLHSLGILTDKEISNIEEGFVHLDKEVEVGNFTIKQEQEDGHTAIEQFLTEKYGEVGKKIHTGRSRNDQVLVMMRLFMKDQIKKSLSGLKELTKEFQAQSLKYNSIQMPGYTHMQKAMPTTVGARLGSYADALSDCILLFPGVQNFIDQNPLGSASGFGISNFTLKRSETTEELGFSKTQENPLYCGFSRGYFETIVLQLLGNIMTILGRFSCDMMQFTMQETSFFSLPEQFTTGSSIMPQKRNYDVFEIMRANTKVFMSHQQQIQGIIMGLGSGYHRDLQLTKKSFVEGSNLCLDTIQLVTEIIKEFIVNKANLEKAMTPELFVTEKVYDLVNQGMSFRDAYISVKKERNQL